MPLPEKSRIRVDRDGAALEILVVPVRAAVNDGNAHALAARVPVREREFQRIETVLQPGIGIVVAGRCLDAGFERVQWLRGFDARIGTQAVQHPLTVFSIRDAVNETVNSE